MSDPIDEHAVRSGDKDLARRDLRGGDFRGLELAGVDLTEAHLEKSNFSAANLREAMLKSANTSGMSLEEANLAGAKAPHTVFFNVNLQRASLRGGVFEGCHFTGAVFNGADLRGADFRKVHINDRTDFTDAIVDETTLFDGARVLRPIARQDAFRYYEVDRGSLVRKKEGRAQDTASAAATALPKQNAVTPTTTARRTDQINQTIDEILASLEPLRPSENELTISPGMGHNNPPEPTPLDRKEFDDLTGTLRAVAIELQHEEVRKEVIKEGASKVDGAASKISAWVARKADLTTEEFAKQLGKTAADGKFLLATYLVISGKMNALVDILTSLFP